jgi:hypothetical protein
VLPELLQFHFDRIYASREIMQYQTQSTGSPTSSSWCSWKRRLFSSPRP